MRLSVTCDASAVVAMLVDAGPAGQWAAGALAGSRLVAPTLLGFECVSVLRRHERTGLIGKDQAVQAHEDFLALAVELWRYRLIARRVWELRENLSTYDAGYVAVAELTGAPLITLDARIAQAPGIRCPVRCPSTSSGHD